MKKMTPAFILAACLVCLPAFAAGAEGRGVLDMVRPSRVVVVTNKAAAAYNSHDETSGRIGFVKEGTKLEIVRDRSAKWYLARSLSDGAEHWLRREDLNIPPDEPAVRTAMTDEQVELFANLSRYASPTDYLIFTDISRQTTYVLTGKAGNWRLSRRFPCSSGRNISPTTTGCFSVKNRGEWFYSERLKSGAKYWLQFNGSYLFHSYAMDKQKNTIDTVLGEKRSMGCVRLATEDARWLYETIPNGTTVWIV